ncbi:hypothetical protein CHS0354_019695 [Potamilus streckersoni]|uniref:Uncharacterized protein n=1 Tax=Potamilus streckersoni TaxID=2493646 RepID=A0AAE0SA52_9BIVA|nr:hypothetical protein CHS0354_019695 [Potamilus streckersoni]
MISVSVPVSDSSSYYGYLILETVKRTKDCQQDQRLSTGPKTVNRTKDCQQDQRRSTGPKTVNRTKDVPGPLLGVWLSFQPECNSFVAVVRIPMRTSQLHSSGRRIFF